MKNISILPNKIILKRINNNTTKSGIYLNNKSTTEFKGTVVKLGKDLKKEINISVDDIVTYSFPETIKINDEEYDFITLHQIKFVENKNIENEIFPEN